MTNYYTHPNLPPSNSVMSTRNVLDLLTGEFSEEHPLVEIPSGESFTTDFDKYFEDLRNMTRLRRSLKIPDMTYHAHMFASRSYDQAAVFNLVSWARERYETRWWVNPVSALLLIAIADKELGEEAGWAFYEYGAPLPSRQSFGCPAWWEFCSMGTYIPPDWRLSSSGSGYVRATSPDGRYGMVIGGS